MSRDRFVWILRGLWAVQPLTAGSALALGIDSFSAPMEITVSVGVWLAWAVALAAMLTPMPVSLVVMRTLVAAAPLAIVIVIALMADTRTNPFATATAVGVATIAAGVALAAPVGDRFVDGSSYGDERRMLLRPALAVLAGPVVIAWLVTLGGIVAGPLFLAAQRWWLGGAALIVGLPLAAVAFRALYALTQRWVVFVPAGVVLRDTTTLADPVLFRREGIDFLGPALASSEAHDLTAAAPGLAIEMQLIAPTPLPIKDPTAGRSASITPTDVDAVLIAPSLPGAVLDEAAKRKIAIR